MKKQTAVSNFYTLFAKICLFQVVFKEEELNLKMIMLRRKVSSVSYYEDIDQYQSKGQDENKLQLKYSNAYVLPL